jgi:hypothetical protein
MNKRGRRLVSGISKRLLHARKYLHRVARAASPEHKKIVFIFGCQRSGTTLVQDIFDQDYDATVYGEFDARVYNGFRLKPLEELAAVMARERAALIVVKPIVETQNALRLLAFFPGAKALFIYRHYAAVAASNLALFGPMNGINDLRPIADGDGANWRAEGVRREVRAMVAARFHEKMNPYDAAALFWYARNRFFFDLELDRHPAVKLCSYEHLVGDPPGMIGRMYRLLDMEPPPAGGALVRSESSGRRKDIRLSPDVERLCRGLLERLDRQSAEGLAERAAA